MATALWSCRACSQRGGLARLLKTAVLNKSSPESLLRPLAPQLRHTVMTGACCDYLVAAAATTVAVGLPNFRIPMNCLMDSLEATLQKQARPACGVCKCRALDPDPLICAEAMLELQGDTWGTWDEVGG